MSDQTTLVLRLLRERGAAGVTPLDALFGDPHSFRLAARIWDLRHAGYDITREWYVTERGDRVARYVLNETAQIELGLGA